MSDEIRVYVVDYGKKNLMMRYRDPLTGKVHTRSTYTKKRREAEKKATEWEVELRSGQYFASVRMPWGDFRLAYERAAFPSLKPATERNYTASIDLFESLCKPKRLGDLVTPRVTAFANELRKGITRERRTGERYVVHLSEASIARHLRTLKAVARWAYKEELLPRVPQFSMPKKAAGARRMKGRPITTEEFERMLAAARGVVGEKAAESWKFLLRGLWASGLRLGEAMALRWDHQPDGVSILLDGGHSVLVFDAASQKSGKVQHVPVAPELVELLEPRQRATGYVFSPKRKDGEILARHVLKVGKTISAIGAAAGVVTDPAKSRTATAHDLRRAFGSRWSRVVMPATLKELMRHASIETTMTYYVQQSAQTTSSELWALRGNLLGNPGEEKADEQRKVS